MIMRNILTKKRKLTFKHLNNFRNIKRILQSINQQYYYKTQKTYY